MGLEDILGGLNISTTAMAAERKRMAVITENISKAGLTSDPSNPGGGPYVRKRVFFREALGEAMKAGVYTPKGVIADDPVPDSSGEFPVVKDPGHPDADENGFVKYSNVNLVYEMLDLTVARRSYEANLATYRIWRNIGRKALELMR